MSAVMYCDYNKCQNNQKSGHKIHPIEYCYKREISKLLMQQGRMEDVCNDCLDEINKRHNGIFTFDNFGEIITKD